MKKFALLASAATLLAASSALAADLPARKVAPAAPVAPAFTWSGFYIGLNAGYGGDTFKYPITSTSAGTTTAGNVNLNSSGPLGGAQIGYNYQMGAFVLGAEADFAFANIQGNVSGDGAGLTGGASIGSQIQNLGTVRVRLGYAWERALFYATGGWAYGNVKTSFDAGTGTPGGSYANANMQNGWTLGVGIEYALTNNITFKTEYLYVDLGQANALTYSSAGSTLVADVETKAQIVRVGLNYKF